MADFKFVTFEEWQEQAKSDLKTDDAYLRLFKDINGLKQKPYYDQADLPESSQQFYGRFTQPDENGISARGWYNIVQIHVKDAAAANAQALEELMNGAEGICFILSSEISIDVLLQDILPQYIFLAFHLSSEKQADEIRSWLDHQDVDKEQIHAYIALSDADTFDHYFSLFTPWPNVRCLRFHLSAEENSPLAMATLMHQVSQTVDILVSKGCDVNDIAREIILTIDTGANYFREIIRIRALRILVFKVLRAWGADCEPEDLIIHGISLPWISESLQPRSNMIKAATSAMAIVLGGANVLTVVPEDKSSALDCRIARNVSIILKEECYLDKTMDPVEGAYYIESCTDQLARAAWAEFQKLNA